MNTLLTTLNTKFSHSSLSIRYLKAYVKGQTFEPHTKEFTINQHADDIVRNIMLETYDCIIFSCYIWNYEMILKISQDIKLINPEITIVLGGPEVSYQPENILKENSFIDFIIFGEGEESFKALMFALENKKSIYGDIEGIAYRLDGIHVNPKRSLIEDLDQVPFPYDGFSDLEFKKIYYESSRGCPFNCQYCLSSTTGRVRFFGLERVKRDLLVFINEKLEQVKFVDRTFNADPKRALEIFRFIHEHDNGITNFHFEIVASLLNEETLLFLKEVRVGLFQFEIGVQTTNDQTMDAIKRKIDFGKLSSAVEVLSSYHNIHLHLDLIAGLPYEGYDSFLNSFEDVYALKPEKLQLGFLKLLKGSGLRVNAHEHGYVYSQQAPYEIFRNKYIGYDLLTKLKFFEEILEIYYNSLGFINSLDMVIKKHYNRAADFYIDFSQYWLKNHLFDQPHKTSRLYAILMQFYLDQDFEGYDYFKEVVKHDYFTNHQKMVTEPFGLSVDKEFTNICYDFLKDQTLFDDESISAKQWLKRAKFIPFDYDVIAFIKAAYFIEDKEEQILMYDYQAKNHGFHQTQIYNITKQLNKE